jgi:hypothetical protein
VFLEIQGKAGLIARRELNAFRESSRGNTVTSNRNHHHHSTSNLDMIGTPGNLTLFTLDGLPFTGSVTSLPFAIGTILAGAAPFKVYLDDGWLNPLVVIGRDRSLMAVPESGSVTLAGLSVLVMATLMAGRGLRLSIPPRKRRGKVSSIAGSLVR